MADVKKIVLPGGTELNIVMETMTGASSSAAGSAGAVPAPSAGDESKFLAGDGTWKTAGGGGGGASFTYASYTIAANGWSNSQYSFESSYSSSSYDIMDIIPNENTTSAQRDAWIAADCGGYYTTNIIIAHGTVPTIDIPITLVLMAK